MDFETVDGSQFSVREIWSDRESNTPRFEITLITAFVDGKPYAGEAQARLEDLDEVDFMQYLQPVPMHNIFPEFPSGFTEAPAFNGAVHYLKAPQFTHEDVRTDSTFVADCLLREATVMELLRKHPHANIVNYFGCVVADGRITRLALQRCPSTLRQYLTHDPSYAARDSLFDQLRSAVEHVHALGLAHNDLNPGWSRC